MAVLETFSEIRRGFRELWDDLNGGILDLEIVCPNSWDSRDPTDWPSKPPDYVPKLPDCFRPEDVIGKIRVPLNEDLSVFSHSAEPIQIDAHRVQPAQIKAFVDLCRNAGSLLPSTRKYELRLYCDWDSRKPEELWIAHLLCLTEQYSQARLGIDFICILKPIQFSADVITDWMDAGLFPIESPSESLKKTRERANFDAVQDLANHHYRELWPIRNAAEWGRFLADKLQGRKQPIDRRTVQKLDAWKRATERHIRTGQLRGRLEQHGVPKELLEQVADPDASNFQNAVDDRLDAELKARLKNDPEVLRLFEEQLKDDSNSQYVQKDGGTT